MPSEPFSADSPLQQQWQTDGNKSQLGECLFLQVYILVHLQSQVSLTLCTIRMKNNLSKCGPSACWTANKNLRHSRPTQFTKVP